MLPPGLPALLPPGGGNLQGVVPVRLRTPSGKTGLFYAPAAGTPLDRGGVPPALAATNVVSGCPEVPSPEVVSNGPAFASQTRLQQQAPPRLPEHAAVVPDVDDSVSNTSAACEEACAEASPYASEQEEPATGSCEGGNVAPAQFHAGDFVYRHGELASVIHVDSTLDPASYIVRMVCTGQEVSCEAEHLVLGAYADQVATNEVQHSSVQSVPSVFGDAMQMQCFQPASFVSQVPLSDQWQQFSQMQQLQHMQMQEAQQIQEHQQLQQAYQMEQLQHMYGAAGIQPQPSREAIQMMQGLSGLSGEPSLPDASQMQQQHALCPSQFESPAFASVSSGHVENDALKAAAAALDRAEVDMLMGGRLHRRSPEPGIDSASGDWPRHPCGDAFARGGVGSANFALQAAADALGALDQGSSLAGRLAGGVAQVGKLDPEVRQRPYTSPQSDSLSTQLASQFGDELPPTRTSRSAGTRRCQEAGVLELPGWRLDDEPLAAAGFTSRQVPRHHQQPVKPASSSLDGSVRDRALPGPTDPDPRQAFDFASFQCTPGSTDNGHTLSAAAGSSVPGNSDEEEERMAQEEMELERIAQEEMEDDIFDFPISLPPKPSTAQCPVRRHEAPLTLPPEPAPRSYITRQPGQPLAEQPLHDSRCEPHLAASNLRPRTQPDPSCSIPTRRKSSAKARNKFADRDNLVNFILYDDPLSRAVTPRGSSRSTRRGSSIPRSLPMAPSTRRSQSHDVHFDDVRRRAAPSSMKITPRHADPRQIASLFSGGKSPMLDILNLPGDGFGTPMDAKALAAEIGSPSRSEASSASSLPQLNEKPPRPRKPVAAVAPKSARSWRGNASHVYGS